MEQLEVKYPSRSDSASVRSAISRSASNVSDFNPNPSLDPNSSRFQEQPNDLRNSRFCFHLTKYETFINILGVFGIIIGLGKIGVIGYYIQPFYDHFPERQSYYMCGFAIIMSAIVIIWEFPMLYFVRKRRLNGLQQYMFAMMLHCVGSILFTVVTGAVYEYNGMFLPLSYIADVIRVPCQMFLVHKFIKSEKLNEEANNYVSTKRYRRMKF